MSTRTKQRWVARTVAGVMTTVGATGTFAQPQLERVEITGSAIKRVNEEGPAPVEIINRKAIARTGATTVNELIRSISSIDIYDQGELTGNSPVASGAANVALRALALDNTLVLVNGRRVAINAFYDSSGAGAAFDINMVPVSMIERIEILKDGGSAIYGADAVAGVINIITRRDYQGVNAITNYGQSSRGDAKEKAFGLSAGFGDLSADQFNVSFGLDVFKRTPIYRKDREMTRSADFRRYGGGDGRSSFAPSGNIVDPNTGEFVDQTYGPCPAENFNVRCRYDFSQTVLTAYNGADRVSGMATGAIQFTPNLKGFVELLASRSRDTFESHPVPDFFLMPITDPSQMPYEDPANPGSLYIAGRFMQGGPRITQRESKYLNTVAGVEGTVSAIDWRVALGQGISKITNADRNYFDYNLWLPATTSGALDPTVNTNDPAFVESLKVTPYREGKATTRFINLDLSGDVTRLPAGMLRYAVGASVMRERLVDTPDALTQAGEVVGNIQQAAVDASRTARGVFGELSIPLLKNLESQVALRYDRYPSESKTSPKVALAWRAIPEVKVRSSYAESFKAPVLKQLYGGHEQGAITIEDPDQCVGLGLAPTCSIAAFQVNGSNTELKAEKAKTYNIGLILEPMHNVSASIDFWKIKKRDDISAPTVSTAIERGLYEFSAGRYYISTNLLNLTQRVHKGVDLDARARVPGTPAGTLTFQNTTTYYSSLKRQDSAEVPLREYANTYALPRWRNTFRASAESGPWTVSGALRSVGGFWDKADYLDEARNSRKVGAYDETDLQIEYTGVKGLIFTSGIKNVFDRMPPFSNQNASDNTYSQMGFAELYNNRGRFWYLTLAYAFK